MRLNRRTILPLLFILFLTACGSPGTPPPTVTASPVPEENLNAVTASAEVVPVQKVELSFPITGSVKTVEVAAGDQVRAGQTLVTLDAGILEARVAEAEANIAIAETEVRYLKRVGTTQEHMDAAIAEVDRAKAVLESARGQLAQAVLTAPMDGTIASVDISPAETVTPGQIVVVIGDLTHMQIETTDLSERDIPFVREGMQAIVFIDALKDEFNGTVRDIARQSEIVGGDVVYKVTIEFDEQPEGLRWGMSAEVRIPKDQ